MIKSTENKFKKIIFGPAVKSPVYRRRISRMSLFVQYISPSAVHDDGSGIDGIRRRPVSGIQSLRRLPYPVSSGGTLRFACLKIRPQAPFVYFLTSYP